MIRPRFLPVLLPLLLGLAGCARDATPPPAGEKLVELDNVGLDVGQKAPDITGEDVQGNRLRLSDYHGKVVVLEFWRVS